MKKIIVIAAIFATGTAFSQQIQYQSQYMLNSYLINPAAAGTMDDLPIALTFRQQWAGFNDAPITQTLSGHTLINPEMGVGAIFMNDHTGPLNKFSFQGSYAYHFKVSEKAKIALGLSATAQYYTLDQAVLKVTDVNDAVINGAKQKTFVPDFSFGSYFYGDEFFAGIAIPQLFNMKMKLGDEIAGVNRERQHMFVHGGYRFKLHEDWMLEPSALIKMVYKAPVNFDVNVRTEYKQFLWAGFSYRHKDAVVALLGIARDQFRIGYSYDFTTSNIKNYSSGTHELYLQYRLKLKAIHKASI
jgi:type IX secretion system PorP/SprF family membrane protein